MSDQHPIMPSTSLILDGREFLLLFDFNAQAVFEEITGITVVSLFSKKGKLLSSARYTRALLFCQLLHQDEQVEFDEFGRITTAPEFNMQQLGRKITPRNLSVVSTATRKALISFFKDPEKDQAEKENPPGR